METACYIAEFSAELAALARQSQLDALACLLEMVRIEAVHTARPSDRP
jgi:hypothetical protein